MVGTLFSAYALLLVYSLWCTAISALPSSNLPQLRPLVIWHGMGDNYDAPGILEFIQAIKDIHPGIFVHSIFLKEASDEDRKATYVRSSFELGPMESSSNAYKISSLEM